MACPNSCREILQTMTTSMMMPCCRLMWERSIGCLRPFLSGGCQYGTQPPRHPLPARQVLQTLSLDDEIGVALVDEHNGRPQEPVVVARHRVIVGAGRLYRQDVARFGPRRHRIPDQDVRLTVLAGDGYQSVR